MGDDESTQTRNLMESYGVTPARIDHQPARLRVSDVIREAIETGVIPQFEDRSVSVDRQGAMRDDIALQRWREMAGLSDE